MASFSNDSHFGIGWMQRSCISGNTLSKIDPYSLDDALSFELLKVNAALSFHNASIQQGLMI
jgi:hypothetical protein